MIFTLTFILLAGLLIKSFYTHYISEKRKFFSFDDRRFTDDDYLKVQNLNIGRLERIFLFIMLGLFIVALVVHLFMDPVTSVWIIALFVAAMLLLNLMVDLKLYTVAYDKSHVVMAVIWAVVIIAIFVFLSVMSINDVELEFDDDGFVIASGNNEVPYENINSVEMTDETPEIPFNHVVLGGGGHLHGTFIRDSSILNILAVEDSSQEMIQIETEQGPIYINDGDPEVTESWFNDLSSQIDN